MRTYTFFLLVWLFFGLTACSTENTISQNKIGVLFTNASQPDSAFVIMDKKGTIESQVNIPAMGIFQVIRNENGNFLFPVQYDNKLFTLSPTKQLTSSSILPFPLYMSEVENFRLTTYNSSLHSGTVEWKDVNRTKRVQLPGFPRVATYDDQKIYVFATIIQQKKPVLYVLDRSAGTVDKVIPLQIDQANDLEIIDKKLFITSTASEKRIAILHLSSWKIDYLSLPKSQPEYILTFSNNILITYQGSTTLTILDRRSLRIQRAISLPQPVLKAKLDGNYLYVLSQIPNSGQGVIGVYRLSDWKLTRKIMLPAIRNTLIQDFVVF
ncbi:hypothetical protein [Shimazuella alba]|uniref:Lipoprotein n=1 Tax=Shimazuella alba TaxID=2690964 RepID=A0A6I4VXS2_9BACL|nr:hypothetical protein [Shimazuella alba]MXQ53254.1 hypothetical protein [Shimazuella alba]